MTRSAMYVWFAVFVALVFVAGVGTGVVVGPRLLGVPGAGPLAWLRPGLGPSPGVRPGPAMPAPLVRRLAEELELDPAQQQKLDAVLARRRERLLSFGREARERFETEQRELRREIAEVLTPEQRVRFEVWLERPPRRGLRRPGGPLF